MSIPGTCPCCVALLYGIYCVTGNVALINPTPTPLRPQLSCHAMSCCPQRRRFQIEYVADLASCNNPTGRRLCPGLVPLDNRQPARRSCRSFRCREGKRSTRAGLGTKIHPILSSRLSRGMGSLHPDPRWLRCSPGLVRTILPNLTKRCQHLCTYLPIIDIYIYIYIYYRWPQPVLHQERESSEKAVGARSISYGVHCRQMGTRDDTTGGEVSCASVQCRVIFKSKTQISAISSE